MSPPPDRVTAHSRWPRNDHPHLQSLLIIIHLTDNGLAPKRLQVITWNNVYRVACGHKAWLCHNELMCRLMGSVYRLRIHLPWNVHYLDSRHTIRFELYIEYLKSLTERHHIEQFRSIMQTSLDGAFYKIWQLQQGYIVLATITQQATTICILR